MNITAVSPYYAHHTEYLQISCDTHLNLYVMLPLQTLRQVSLRKQRKLIRFNQAELEKLLASILC